MNNIKNIVGICMLPFLALFLIVALPIIVLKCHLEIEREENGQK